jgi:hypoxanthine-guanine phosphoribosyltransferase
MNNSEIVQSNSVGQFILLNDFFDSFDKMKLPLNRSDIEKHILFPFRNDLEKIIPNLVQYDINTIREIVNGKIDSRYYIITMDNGTYFHKYDFSINISRTAFNLNNINTGPYFRVPRDDGKQIISQCQALNAHYSKYGNGKPIVLCDDGVGTGKSLQNIINILDELKISTFKIFVLLNPNKLTHIDNYDIVSLIKSKDDYNWLSERDLFWGIPRSGVTCSITQKKGRVIFGVPYTIDVKMIQNRVSDFGDNTQTFREICIKYNILLWKYIEQKTNKKYLVKDINRLKHFGDILGVSDVNILEYLSSINNHKYLLDEFIGK